MEPIGFAASLITVVGLVTASSKKIHDLRRKLGNAPKDAENILEQVHTYANLLDELKTQLQDHRNSVPPQETLQGVWASSIAQMQQDVQSLQAVLSKYESLLKKKSRSSKILLVARHIVSEKEVERYQRKIDVHCSTLTNIQGVVCGRKLDKVSESITQLGEEDRAGFQTLTSELSQTASRLSSEAKAGFSTISSLQTVTESANEARHQMVLAHLDDHAKRDDVISEKIDEVFEQHVRSMDMNEAGFQAVHSSLVAASSSSKEDHKKTHAMLSRFQSQLQQMVRKHVAFGTIGDGVRLSKPPVRSSNPMTETTVFWKHSFYCMPIGILKITRKTCQRSRNSSRSASHVSTESDIAVEFVPPRWLSSVLINYSMKLSYDLVSHQLRLGATLRPLTVNYNEYFINAVLSVDVEGVRRSFAEGLARPTDCILGLRHWSWFLWLSNPRSPDVVRYFLMMDFMVENDIPGQEHIIQRFAKHVTDGGRDDLLRNSLQKYSKRSGKVLAADSPIFGVVFMRFANIDWITDYLLDPLERWLVDDLSSFQICLIGALAHFDAVFRNRLRKELASYRSPASAGRPSFGDYLLKTKFSRASIESNFQTLNLRELGYLWRMLCRTGSRSMMKFFMDIAVDANRVASIHRMLGHAAAKGSMDIVNMLLEAGANGSLAINDFCCNAHLPDAHFRRLLELLVENARPVPFDQSHDPFFAIIKSSRALCSYPQAPEILLDRKIFDKAGFGEGASKAWVFQSYMYQAISRRNSSVVDLLLRNGAHADARISDSFDCYNYWVGESTWTTFCVIRGAASCTDVLIQHGADVTALDGAGRSALQLARNHVLRSHPRNDMCSCIFPDGDCITAEEDAETLAVVERAFTLKFQGTKSLDDYLNLSNEVAPQPPSRRERLISLLQETFEKVLGTFLTPTQTELLLDHLKRLYKDIRKLWSLSFSEALLMRSLYVISYALLLAYEIYALIKGRKRIPMPSRFLLSTLAFLALAVICGSSRGGFSWGPFSAGTKA